MRELKSGDWVAGEYRVRRVFGGAGQSGMGVVYLVEGKSSEQPFILKTFQVHEESSALIARFEREADLWIGIGKHPNVVECFWARRYLDQLFVAAEYVWPDLAERNTLSHHVASGSIPTELQLKWLSECCFAMRHATKHGMRFHRDIKPDNLMIDGTGSLKLTDFGLAQFDQRTEESADRRIQNGFGGGSLTVAGSVLGTLPFMAPERFTSSVESDHRSDIYSLGVVAFMMATGGSLPIIPSGQTNSIQAWADAHARQRFKSPHLPLGPIIDRCLAKDPRGRYQSFDELLSALAEVGRRNRIDPIREKETPDRIFSSEWTKAMSLVGTGKFADAEVLLRKLIDQWPDRSALYTELSGALAGQRRWNEAVVAARHGLQIEENSTAAWNNLGGALASMGKLREAKESFLKALSVDPENSGAMISLARLYLEEGDLEQARSTAELACFWRPEKIAALQALSECCMRQREVKRATEVLRKLVDLEPDDAVAWFNLALCRRFQGDSSGCIFALERVVSLRGDDSQALNMLLDQHAADGSIAEAISISERLGRLPGWELKATAKRAQLYAARGDTASAYMVLNSALKTNERSAILWFAMSAVLHGKPQYHRQAQAAVRNALLCAREHPGQLTEQNLEVLQHWASDAG